MAKKLHFVMMILQVKNRFTGKFFFRHDNETKQWKERGLGEIKILKHKETGRCRVLMRREQVLKLCANHYITAEMSLNPLKTSDRAWCWYASDYSEDEVTISFL